MAVGYLAIVISFLIQINRLHRRIQRACGLGDDKIFRRDGKGDGRIRVYAEVVCARYCDLNMASPNVKGVLWLAHDLHAGRSIVSSYIDVGGGRNVPLSHGDERNGKGVSRVFLFSFHKRRYSGCRFTDGSH